MFKALKEQGVTVVIKGETQSTNSDAKLLAADGCDEAIIIADSQTGGRGRMGRQFYSPKGTGLYMSYLFKPCGDFSDSVAVTAATAVAVAKAIEQMTDLKPQIKWVNDIFLGGKKVGGILTEAVCGKTQHIIIGIGVNITTDCFPENLCETAAALNREIDRDLLAVNIVNALRRLIKELPGRSFIEDYRKRSLVLGKQVEFTKGGVSALGVAVDIDRNGALIVETDNGKVLLNSGEISLAVK